MSISVFVGQDSQGHNWSPDHAHEIEGLLGLLTHLWKKYQHLQEHYCVLTNIKAPDADVILFSERGIGVIELKHYAGRIRIDEQGKWTADDKPIKAGVHADPHKQVQVYAHQLREKILPFILPDPWVRDRQRWTEVKTQTAVCFTHPQANLEDVGSGNKTWNSPRVREPWEDNFEIIRPTDAALWAFKLRLGITLPRNKNFEPIRITAEEQVRCAEMILGGKPWTDIQNFMPTNQPYGYLYLHLSDGPDSIFNLDKDRITIGRSMDCDIVIPSQFKRVSGHHCEITRSPRIITLTNLEAKNGTFINGKPISHSQVLSGRDVITLGNMIADEKSCQLRLQLRQDVSSQVSITEM
jgi:hypothetical protein